jgi:hypothetical protein
MYLVEKCIYFLKLGNIKAKSINLNSLGIKGVSAREHDWRAEIEGEDSIKEIQRTHAIRQCS